LADRAQHFVVNDQARLALEAWRDVASAGTTPSIISRALRDTEGGRNLQRIGHASDLELAAHIDRFDIVPELDRSDWSIRVASTVRGSAG
jgi:phosphosulfolactate phosphohydrolase-like enzyme